MDINYFLKINNTYNTTSDKDVQLYNLKNQVNDRFMDTIDYYKVKINEIDRDVLIVRTVKTDEKTIKSRAGETFEIGDYVVFENNTWLVITKDMCNQVYTSGTLKLTNYSIKFQAPDGTILSYPIIAETNSTIGIDVNTVLTVPNSVFTIKLPFDAYTSTLKEDRRLFIDKDTVNPRSYKITKINNVEFNYGDKGLIVLTLERTVGDYPKDRVDLGICDYFEPTNTPIVPPIGNYSMSISASGKLYIGGNARTFTPMLIDSNGVLQTFVGVWTFNYNGMPVSDFTITYNGNSCVVKVTEDFDIIDNVLVLTCTSDDGLYSTSYNATITAQ